VECCDNSSVRLDLDNEPQPDLVLIKLPAKGGQARISEDDYIEGAPELAVEIVAVHVLMISTKKRGLPRNVSWSISLDYHEESNRLVELREGSIRRSSRIRKDCSRAACFLSVAGQRGPPTSDMKTVLVTLRRGLDSPNMALLSAVDRRSHSSNRLEDV